MKIPFPKILPLLILCLGCNLLPAQQRQGHYLLNSGEYAFFRFRDAGFSSLGYRGHYGGGGLGYLFQNERLISEFRVDGQYGLSGPEAGNAHLQSFLAHASYTLLTRVWKDAGELGTIYAGLTSDNFFHFRYHPSYSNNGANYEGISSIVATARVYRDFELFGKNFIAETELGLPLLTYAMRPGYVLPFDGNRPDKRQWAFYGDYFHLRFRSSLSWVLKNGNCVGIFYDWIYYDIDLSQRVQGAVHRLGIQTALKF